MSPPLRLEKLNNITSVIRKGGLTGAPVKQENVALAREEAPELPYVNWRKDPGLRKLYAYCIRWVSFAAGNASFMWNKEMTLAPSSMLNNIRLLPTFEKYFHNPEGSNLGLLTALYSIGSIASLPVVEVSTSPRSCPR